MNKHVKNSATIIAQVQLLSHVRLELAWPLQSHFQSLLQVLELFWWLEWELFGALGAGTMLSMLEMGL